MSPDSLAPWAGEHPDRHGVAVPRRRLGNDVGGDSDRTGDPSTADVCRGAVRGGRGASPGRPAGAGAEPSTGLPVLVARRLDWWHHHHPAVRAPVLGATVRRVGARVRPDGDDPRLRDGVRALVVTLGATDPPAQCGSPARVGRGRGDLLRSTLDGWNAGLHRECRPGGRCRKLVGRPGHDQTLR